MTRDRFPIGDARALPKHLSPQARRRLARALHGVEWSDLASEIADALEATTGNTMDRAAREAIYSVLADGDEGPDEMDDRHAENLRLWNANHTEG